MPILSIRDIRITNGETPSPPSGKYWKVLNGIIQHITGTDSNLQIQDPAGKFAGFIGFVGSAKASAYYPAFGVHDEVTIGATTFPLELDNSRQIIIDSNHKVSFTADATAVCYLEVIETNELEVL